MKPNWIVETDDTNISENLAKYPHVSYEGGIEEYEDALDYVDFAPKGVVIA